MTLAEFYTRTSYALRGTDEDSPEHGSEEATMWLSILNRKKDELYENVAQNWSNTFKETAPNEPGTVATVATTALTGTSTFFTDYAVGDKITVSGETVRTIATITSDTALTVSVAFSNTASSKTFTRAIIIDDIFTSYSLHRSFLALSGDDVSNGTAGTGVYVLKTDGNNSYLPVVSPERRDPSFRSVFIGSLNPQKVYFSDTIASTEDIVGGTLYYPGYFMPDDVSAATDLLPFLDPNWAVMAVASEIAFNDITYEDKSGDLNAKANALFMQMSRKNKGLVFNTPRPVPYNIKRIRGF